MYLTESGKLNGRKKEVPPLNIHRYSCEMVFFLVLNNTFNLNITGIDGKISSVTLVMFKDDDDIYTYEQNQKVNNYSANFSIKLVRKTKTDEENIEKIA
jgi:hypothetical protein